jgi:hypothetical protein
MKKRENVIKFFVVFTVLLSILLSFNFIQINQISNGNGIVARDLISKEKENEGFGQKTSDIPSDIGGYTTLNDSSFHTIQNASSLISQRDFFVDPSSQFEILTPQTWNVSSASFSLDPYEKNQTILDPNFDLQYTSGINYWGKEKVDSGLGYFTFADLDKSTYGSINMYNLKRREFPGFYAGDHAYWTTEINQNGLDVARGKIIQEQDEKSENFDFFQVNPEFSVDLDSPYGGNYDPEWDTLNLYYDDSSNSLKTLIDPGVSSLGGNPSAAWWYYLRMPFQPDYAQMKITWSLGEKSTFEASDNYEIVARINDRYVNGKNIITKTGDVPFNGSENALMVYNNTSVQGEIHHGTISRTYNITDLVNGLLEFNKFDFGVWAKNPTHEGDADPILVNFESVEFMVNTSTKYEIASLQYKYKLIDEDIINSNPFENTEDASFVLYLEDLDIGKGKLIEVLPLSQAEVGGTFLTSPWVTMNFSLSQDYEDLLQANNLGFKIGILFNNEFYPHIDLTHYLDDVYFMINYLQDINSAKLFISVDGSLEVPINNNYYVVDTSSWMGGQIHNFQFNTSNGNLLGKLYLNFNSLQEISFKSNQTHQAIARYSIEGANAARGVWNVSYDNTFSYTQLFNANFTELFTLSSYSLSFINLPALDLNGSQSKNWDIFSAYSPSLIDYTNQLVRFNYSLLNSLQSAKIENAFALGDWMIFGYQPNYVYSCSLNSSLTYLGLSSFNTDDTILYNLSLKENIQGNYSIEMYNSFGVLMNGFPKHNSSNGEYVTGTINLGENYNLGLYYLRFKWNDSASPSDNILRRGSLIVQFYILNGTNAQFTYFDPQVDSGETANFTIEYTTYLNYGIEGANIVVYENSTGTLRQWGRAWTGSYEVDEVTYLGAGEYNISLFTEGAPNGTYPLYFVISKYLHRTQVLQTSLKVVAEFFIEFDIISGAFNDSTNWIIDSNNIPYVNDSINSIVRINLTDQDKGTPLTGGLVIGTIGETEYYFEGVEIGGGLYDLTLDTTSLNASTKSGSIYLDNETLEIRCIHSGYNVRKEEVTIFIDKIPTQIDLQPIDPVYAQSSISIIASMVNKIDPNNPQPNDIASMTYYIRQGNSTIETGFLNHLLSGVYQNTVSLSGLSAGNYSIYVNGTAINCEVSQSNFINFEVLPQESTILQISLPDTIRILKEFQIRVTLSYAVNDTRIANQAVSLNITLGASESFIVSTATNIEGISTYYYIISSQYKGQNITIHATYNGQDKIEGTSSFIERSILGKIPIYLNIYKFPNTLRVGYSAQYGLQINITEGGESLQNRIILFSAYYGSDLNLPFYTDQLYTDVNGNCDYIIPEIEDGEQNITIFFEYLGSTTVSYNITSRLDIILPKWSSSFTLSPLPTTIRFGQTLEFSLAFLCENSSISLENLQVSFSFKYGTIVETYTKLIDVNNTLIYEYQVADSFTGDINYTITFFGTNQISGYSISSVKVVYTKIQVQLEFIQSVQNQYLIDTYPFEVRVTDELGSPLDGLLIVFEVLNANDEVISNTTALCDNGIAVGSVSLPIGNNYKIRVKFDALSYYEASSIISGNIRVVNEFLLFLDFLPMIGITAAIIAGIGFVIHRAVIVPKRRRREESLKKLYQKLSDVENVQYILILTEHGVPCYSKSLADVPIDETLISGFLSAITSFGKEIGTKITTAEGGLEELSYRQFKIIVNEGDHSRVALLLLKRPSQTLKDKLKKFNTTFEQIYGERLKNFDGQVFEDAPVTKLIEEIFEADLLYPHQIIDSKVNPYLKSSNATSLDKKILIIARSEDFESSFYLRDLINHLKTTGIEEIKSFESIQKLKSDKVVFAINVRTNYLIAEFKKYIKFMEKDDREVLFAIFDGQRDIMNITKYLKKRDLTLKTDINIVLEKLKRLHMINDSLHVTEEGSAVATLLKLIPDL